MLKKNSSVVVFLLLCGFAYGQISNGSFGITEWINGPHSLYTQPYPMLGPHQTIKPGWLRQWDTYSNWPYMHFYDTGLVTVKNGSAEVVGLNAGWNSNMVGATLTAFHAPGFSATVASVHDADHLTLTAPWVGPDNVRGGYTLHLPRGHYNWTQLDRVLDEASSNQADLLYTFQMIPNWATGNHTDPNCHRSSSAGYGTCYPPADLYQVAACQGSLAGTVTTNCMVKEFVTDLMNHAKSRGTPIRFIELGNEVPICSSNYGDCPVQSERGADGEWSGPIADHVAMSRDIVAIARQIEPDVTIVAPSLNNMDNGKISNLGPAWIAAWLDSGGADLVDAVSFHGYVGNDPEVIVGTKANGTLPNFQVVLNAHGAAGKPLWDTEESWGGTVHPFNHGNAITQISRRGGVVQLSTYPVPHNFHPGDTVTVAGASDADGFNGTFTVDSVPNSYLLTYAESGLDISGKAEGSASNETAQANFLVRRLLLELSLGVQRVGWYAYASDTNPPLAPGALCVSYTNAGCTQLRLAGQAYGELIQWLAGTTPLRPCSVEGTTWTCDFVGPNDRLARAVWNTAGPSSYAAPVGYAQYRTVKGSKVLLAGAVVQIGTSPILLESKASVPVQPPATSLVARLVLSMQSGRAPLAVTADSSGSKDSNATIVASAIDFGDGTMVSGFRASHIYSAPGTYRVTASVRDSLNGYASDSAPVSVAAAKTGPVQPDSLQLVASPSESTLGPDDAATYLLNIAAGGSVQKIPVTFLCEDLPYHMSCSFAPATVVPRAGAAQTVLTVRLTNGASRDKRPGISLLKDLRNRGFGLWFWLPGMTLVGLGRVEDKRKRLKAAILVVMLSAGFLLQTACSLNRFSPAKQYQLKVSGVSGSLKRSIYVIVHLR